MLNNKSLTSKKFNLVQLSMMGDNNRQKDVQDLPKRGWSWTISLTLPIYNQKRLQKKNIFVKEQILLLSFNVKTIMEVAKHPNDICCKYDTCLINNEIHPTMLILEVIRLILRPK